jgi:hypothetical protein
LVFEIFVMASEDYSCLTPLAEQALRDACESFLDDQLRDPVHAEAAKRMRQEWQRSNKSVVAMWTAETARAEKAESDLASTLKELQGELHLQSYHRSIVEDQSHWFTADDRARAAEELYGVSGNFSRVVQKNDFLRAALGLRPE